MAGESTLFTASYKQIAHCHFALCSYEWCMTDNYDPSNPKHVEIKSGIEVGNGLPYVTSTDAVLDALREAGFEIVEARDLAAIEEVNSKPWYKPFEPSYSLEGFKLTRVGIALTNTAVGLLEVRHVMPSRHQRANLLWMYSWLDWHHVDRIKCIHTFARRHELSLLVVSTNSSRQCFTSLLANQSSRQHRCRSSF